MNLFRQFKRYLIYKIKKKIDIDSLLFNSNNLNFEEVFKYFECNKAKEFPKYKKEGHGYSKFYEQYLSLLKNKKLNILEIGSFAGASAASFSKYFPLSTVYCLDINLTNFKFTSKNIKVFGLDISKKSMIKSFYKKIKISNVDEYFDIIIDDGSHKLSDILISLNTFFKNLKPGGFYIVEEYKYPNFFSHLNDCHEKKIEEILNLIKNKKKFKSNILSDQMIDYLLNFTDDIFLHEGLIDHSDIAFIKKLN